MTTKTTTPAAQLVELARLTRVEYERRILLDACWRVLDAVPDGELTEQDQAWRDSMYMSWAAAWERLTTARRELGMVA